MATNLSGLERGIYELTKIGVKASIVSGLTSPFWDSDFKHTMSCIITTSAVAGVGLLSELARRAYEFKNKELFNYDWRIE